VRERSSDLAQRSQHHLAPPHLLASTTVTRANVNDAYVRSFERHLRAKNLSPRTIVNYADAIRALRVHTVEDDLADETPDTLQGFFAAQTASRSATTAAIRFRALQQFYKWATDEELCPDNPMRRLTAPKVPDIPTVVLSIEQVKALLRAAGGKLLVDRRDNAMIRLFLEPGGPRLSEMTVLSVAAVDLESDFVTVMGKGRKERDIPFGAKTGQAVDRYLRLRAAHPFADSPDLWLGKKGAMTVSGVQQMLRRRASQAGIPKLYPHMLRHTAAHEWLDAGGNETDAMRLFGWTSPQMLQRYGRSVADKRAQDAARRMGLGNRY
jgi:site-specific recombinase XerD